MSTDELAFLTWPELSADHVAVLPLGSLEQHGPHLPLDTDTRIAIALAGRAVARARPELRLLLAPAMPYGASGEHAGFPGTVSIGLDALSLVLVEWVRSLGQEFRGVVFVNGHGGNVEAVGQATAALISEGRNAMAWSPRIPGGDAHAGRTETSLMLAIDPDAVRLDRAESGAIEPLAELMDTLRSEGVRGVSGNGVLGDPAGASGQEGHHLLDALTENLVGAIEEHFGV